MVTILYLANLLAIVPTLADTLPIFSVQRIAQYAEWIAEGRVVATRPANCEVAGFGKALAVTFEVESVWKGSLGKSVEFSIFPTRLTTQMKAGVRLVVAFQELAVPCPGVTYGEGVLAVNGDLVDTATLSGEPEQQPLLDLERKFALAVGKK